MSSLVIRNNKSSSNSNSGYFDALNFDGTYQRIFHVFRERWTAFTLIALVMYCIGWIFAILLSLVLGNDVTIDGFSFNYMLAYQFDDWKQSMFYTFEAILYYIFACIAHGASIWLTVHFYLYRYPHIYDSFKMAGRKCWPLVVVTFMKTLIYLLPLSVPVVLLYVLAAQQIIVSNLAIAWVSVISILYGYFVKVVLFVVYSVVMVEGKGPWSSIERSFNLTRGRWGHIFGILLVWGVVKVILSTIIASFTIEGVLKGRAYLIWIAKVLDTISGIFLLAIMPVFEGVIYVSLRVEKEDFDSVKLGKEIGANEGEENCSYVFMVTEEGKEKQSDEVAPKDGGDDDDDDDDEKRIGGGVVA